MRIEYRPVFRDHIESGVFELPSELCADRLAGEVKHHGMRGDRALLAWILEQQASGSAFVIVPSEYDDRMKLLAADLWMDPRCRVRCTACGRDVAPGARSLAEWTDTTKIEGITVGASGDKLSCVCGSVLLYRALRLY